MVKNDPLITYETGILGQAAVKKFFIATFLERKIMSTKTSIKRIALVAAAALAFAGFSAVPAQATSTTTITQAAGTGDGGVGGIAGPANSLGVTITPGGTASGTKTYVTITGGTISTTNGDSVTAVVAANGLSATLTGTRTLTVQTPTAGSLVVNVYDALTASTYSGTVSVTKTIAISAAGIAGVYSAAKSSVFIAAGETSTPVAVDAVVNKAATAASANDTQSTSAATIQVSYKDGNGTAMPQESITATIISGPGTIATTRVTGGTAATSDSTTVLDSTSAGPGLIHNTINQYSASAQSSAAGWANFVIWPNGQTGVSTVVIKNSAGTELGRKTLTFSGTTPASLVATVKKAYVLNSTSATLKAIAVTAADASGNAITGLGAGAITGAVATGSTVGGTVTCGAYDTTDKVYYCSVQASAAQAALTTDATEVYTISTSTTVKTTASVMFVSGSVKTLTIAGPASANPGEKITYTLTAKGANGNPIPDAAYAGDAFTKAPSASASLVTTPFSGVAANESVTVTAGVATATTFAPFGGALTITWTVLGTAGAATGTAGLGTVSIDKALTATDVVSTVEISTDATAALALDAANAATDAANNAYDEAQNATQAASDALAAVTALAKQVKSLIASVKRLTAAVAKLK
jgi:hypothetical protein